MAAEPTGGSSAAGTSSAGATTSSSAIVPEQIWNDIEAAGGTALQAAGIMGNMIAESSLNPEANVVDSNGYRSYGLMQWNAATYPNAASLVTGNPVADALAQVNFFFSTVNQQDLQGSTPAEVAANIAANYERCSTCQSGGSSNLARQGYADTVAGWASSGNWPTTSGQASDTAQIGAGLSSTCAWQIDIPVAGNMCLIQYSQLRGLLATGVLIGGGLVFLIGLAFLMNTTSTGRQIVSSAGRVAGIAAMA